MKNKKYKAVERVLENWRSVKDKKSYGEAYFMGFWSIMTDKQATILLGLLTKEEFEIVINYPIWM